MADKNLKFEQAVEKLEGMIEKIESGELSLDDSIKSFEEGMKLVQFCEEKLNEAQGRLEKLVKNEKGELKPKAFTIDDDEF